MLDAASCEQVGCACFVKAWEISVLNDNSGNREQMQKLFARSVELLDHSLLLLKEPKTNHGTNEHRVCLKMARVYQTAKVFYPDEPQSYQAYYEKAIRYLTIYLEKFSFFLRHLRMSAESPSGISSRKSSGAGGGSCTCLSAISTGRLPSNGKRPQVIS